MTKTGLTRTFTAIGALALVAASAAIACTTKSATLIGRMSVASAPAGSQCMASGQTCTMFEVMSATNADGLALGDLTGKTLKAVLAPGMAMPASQNSDAIWVAKADVNWEKGSLHIASVEPANEAVATAAKASWEKCMTSAAVASASAGSKSGCCAAGVKADAATANSKGTCGASAATASSKGSCAAKADAATANSKGSCGASAATASSKGSCGAKSDAATAGGSSCHSKSAKSEAAAAAARALTFNVNGMTCEGCVSKVEKALLAVKGVASAKVDLEAKQAVVGISDDVKSEDLVKAIETAGFQAQIAAAEKSSEARG